MEEAEARDVGSGGGRLKAPVAEHQTAKARMDSRESGQGKERQL
jgi:hypothetical protein